MELHDLQGVHIADEPGHGHIYDYVAVCVRDRSGNEKRVLKLDRMLGSSSTSEVLKAFKAALPDFEMEPQGGGMLRFYADHRNMISLVTWNGDWRDTDIEATKAILRRAYPKLTVEQFPT